VTGTRGTGGVHTIDALMHGLEHNLSCYFLPGPRPALVEPGPESSLDNVIAALEHDHGVGPEDLAWVVVTHVHLDHGGGAGKIAERFPKATVVVHEQGARHLHFPDRLVASATRVYGEQNMAAMWGSMQPVPEERLWAVDEGDRIDLGGGRHLEVMYTPGHAKHLMCLVDSDTGGVFVGDAVGITLPHTHLVRPTVPPPDIDPDLIVSQLQRLLDRGVTSINFAHFGIDHDVDEMLDQAIRRVRRWDEIAAAAVAEGLTPEELAHRLEHLTHDDYVAEGFSDEVIAATEARTTYLMEASGLHRAHTH
jgi:glyoxylase-like metal-dependent hydrolase (beta-lactamase superfamily II)